MAPAIDARLLSAIRSSYFRPWDYSCPEVGQLKDADCLWVFAFGRNSFTDAELGGVIQDIRQKAGSNNDDMYSLLKRRGFDPGKPNLLLANDALMRESQWMWETGRKEYLPIIAQWEVPYKYYVPGNKRTWDHIFPFWPPADKPYFNSLDGMLECMRISNQLGCKRPAIIAHDAIRVRVLLIAWKLGVNVIVPQMHIDDFDPNCIQPHARNKKTWLPREIVARYVHHPLKGFVQFKPPT